MKAAIRSALAQADVEAALEELLGSDTNFAAVYSTAPFGRAVGSANLGSDPQKLLPFMAAIQ